MGIWEAWKYIGTMCLPCGEHAVLAIVIKYITLYL
jgi:hypothetical protein